MTKNGSYAKELRGVSPAALEPVRRPLSPADREAALERVEAERRERERREAAARHERDTDEATAREAYPEVWAAAELLGMPAREIVAVTVTEEGTLVEYVNSVPSLIVPADRPDADGRSGVMPAREYRRTPTVVAPEPEPEPEPEREPWADLVDADPVVAGLRAVVAGLEAKVAPLLADLHNPLRANQLRRPTQELEAARLLVQRREAEIRAQWQEDHPEPPDPAEVERMALVFVVGRLMQDARSIRQRELIERRYLETAVGSRIAFMRAPTLGYEREAEAAEQYLRSNGIDLPAVPTLEDLEREAAAPAPLTLDELVGLDAGDAA